MMHIPVIYWIILVSIPAALVAIAMILGGPRIILNLILKYLGRRRIAWVSLIAVMLCTAMVLVVISVMGGWLTTFKAKFRGMSGDVIVYRPGLAGFAGYEQMIDQLRQDKDVEEALPLIRSMGLLNLVNQRIVPVQVTGLDIDRFSKFNNFRESLWLQYQKPREQGQAPPEKASFDLLPNMPYGALRPSDRLATQRPGIIVGGPIIGLSRDKNGKTVEPINFTNIWARLEMVPISSEFRSFADIQPVANIYWIVDASRTQLYQLDENSVYVPFDVAQKDLQMNARTVVDGDEEIKLPARCSELQIKLKAGADREAFLARIAAPLQKIDQTWNAHLYGQLQVEPWEKQRETFLNAVENEKLLVTILFGVVSVVAVFLIFCILYMIVVEKTRDIGIIKSVGATSGNVAAIFVGYGLAIGVVGAGAGLGVGFLFLRYINEIHAAIAKATGFTMWDPQVYAFDRIPSQMDPLTAAIVVLVAILSAVLGAVLPAIRAARLNPVEALRFE